MARVQGEIVIRRPVEEVFDFVADERNEPQYNLRLLRVEQLTDGPIGLGTRFGADTAMRRRVVPMTIEFTDFERPRRLASSTRLPTMDIAGTLTFEPVDGGTRMRWCWDLKPRLPLRVLAPLIRRIGERQERAIWSGLKRLLESRPPSRATPGVA